MGLDQYVERRPECGPVCVEVGEEERAQSVFDVRHLLSGRGVSQCGTAMARIEPLPSDVSAEELQCRDMRENQHGWRVWDAPHRHPTPDSQRTARIHASMN